MTYQPHRVQTPDATEHITTAIVDAVGSARGVDPTSLEPPLYDVVDPEAIEALCAHADGRDGAPDGRVTFEWCGCRVEVTLGREVAARVGTVLDRVDG